MTVRLVARPRLVELTNARWERRAVLVVAGPGFGKSMLLSQMMAENALAPRGTDILVGATPADRSPAHFLRRIAAAAGIDHTPNTRPVSAAWLLAELGRRWPLGVCVVLDDVHHVGGNEQGGRLLGRLVTDAPSCVHFVLASRDRVRGLAQLRVAGAVLEIGEADLLFSPSEMVTLAAQHGVDISVPTSTGGWPAAASVAAAYGIRGAEEFVFETVLDHLDHAERNVLAIAAAIGGGDADLLRRAIAEDDVDPTAVLSPLPLVDVSDNGEFTVHDLWRRVVGDVIAGDDLRGVVARCVDALVERDCFDRAFRLCLVHADWERAARVLTACCRHGHVEVPPEVVTEWLAAFPRDRWEEPDGLLLRGLAGRVTDPFGPATAALLERAVDHYRAEGNVAGEVAAGVELVFVLRNQGRCDALPAFLARAAELDAAGHAEAAGPAAVARALFAELSGDDRQMVTVLDSIPNDRLSRGWSAVVAARLAIAHLTLGNEHEMLEAATRCATLADGSTDRHVLALARWFAGDPNPALAACDDLVADTARGNVGAVMLGTIATMVLASAGRTDRAAAQLALTEQAAASSMSALLGGALVGVRALLAAAMGDDDRARLVLEAALDEVPLTDPLGWRRAMRWLPLAYVLLPSIRESLDNGDVGPIHQRRLAVARAVVAARERPAPMRDLGPMTTETIATAVPLPWAMTLAARLAADGNCRGRQIAEGLFELYGEPAKDALRGTTSDPVRRIAEGARKLLAAITIAPRHPVRLDVLGSAVVRVADTDEISDHWNRERVRSLLLYLVIHGPAHREQIVEALWPHLDRGAADRNLRVTLTYLNQVLEPGRQNGEAVFFVRQRGSTLALAGGPHLQVDLDEFRSLVDDAEDADHRGLPTVALELFERALQLWRGPCLSDVAYEEWAQAARCELTARFVAATLRVAELHLAGGRTRRAAERARRVLAVDEWSEPAHRILIASALTEGGRSAAARALADCDAMLADLGVTPGAETEMLRRRLDVDEADMLVSAIA